MPPDQLGIERLDAANLGVRQLARELATGVLVATFPERWHWLERSLRSWRQDVEGVVSAAPCPPELIATSYEQDLAGMTVVYGSSETAGLGVRRGPDSAYRLMLHWRFAEPFDPDVPEILDAAGGRVTLPDRITRHCGDRFELAGRRDGRSRSVAVNVFPAHVAALLRGQPTVRDAEVRMMRVDEGARLKAFVVPKTGVDPAELGVALRAWLETDLDCGGAIDCDHVRLCSADGQDGQTGRLVTAWFLHRAATVRSRCGLASRSRSRTSKTRWTAASPSFEARKQAAAFASRIPTTIP